MGRSRRVGLSGLLAFSALPNASAASISTSGEVTPNTVAPLLLALVIAYFVRRWRLSVPVSTRGPESCYLQ